MTHTVVIDRDKFFKVVEASRREVEIYILGGRCVSFDDYRNKTGQLRGMDVVIDHFKDTVKSEDDDD